MAQAYNLPPWLHGVTPGEIGGLYERGLQTGVGVAETQARLAQQAQSEQARLIQSAQEASQRFDMEQKRLKAEQEQAQMKLQAQQQVTERQFAMDQQKIEMEKAYHDQTIGLRQSQLQDAQKKTQMAAQRAAQQYAAQQSYQMRLTSGEDPSSLLLELGPQMGGVSGAMAQALRDESQNIAEPVKAMDVEGAPAYFQVPSPSGKGYEVKLRHPTPGDVAKMSPATAANMMAKLPELSGVFGTNWVNEISPKLQKRVNEGLADKVDQVQGTSVTPAKPKPAAESVPRKSQRKVGKIYPTPEGDFEWTEKGWRKPKPQSMDEEIGSDLEAKASETSSDDEEE